MDKFPVYGRAKYRINGMLERVTPWRIVGSYSQTPRGLLWAEKNLKKEHPEASALELTFRVQ